MFVKQPAKVKSTLVLIFTLPYFDYKTESMAVNATDFWDKNWKSLKKKQFVTGTFFDYRFTLKNQHSPCVLSIPFAIYW